MSLLTAYGLLPTAWGIAFGLLPIASRIVFDFKLYFIMDHLYRLTVNQPERRSQTLMTPDQLPEDPLQPPFDLCPTPGKRRPCKKLWHIVNGVFTLHLL